MSTKDSLSELSERFFSAALRYTYKVLKVLEPPLTWDPPRYVRRVVKWDGLRAAAHVPVQQAECMTEAVGRQDSERD